jgi:hypothetical protein
MEDASCVQPQVRKIPCKLDVKKTPFTKYVAIPKQV